MDVLAAFGIPASLGPARRLDESTLGSAAALPSWQGRPLACRRDRCRDRDSRIVVLD
jgi:hypothetical protein